MLPPNYSEPPNICTTCGKQWEGNPYEYETDNHEFPCPECAAQQGVQADFAAECAYDEPCKQCIHPVCKNYAKRQNR